MAVNSEEYFTSKSRPFTASKSCAEPGLDRIADVKPAINDSPRSPLAIVGCPRKKLTSARKRAFSAFSLCNSPGKPPSSGGVSGPRPSVLFIHDENSVTELDQGHHFKLHGFTTSNPLNPKSRTFRVTNTNPCVSAVAASRLSIAGTGRAASATRRPQRSATATSIGSNLPAKKPLSSTSNQSESVRRRSPAGSASTPFRNSPSVSTDKYSEVAGRRSTHSTIWGSGVRRRNSDRTLVSSR